MIKFKCIYCGQRILAPDDGVGRKGKCPKCKHELVIPKSTKGRPAISFDKEPIPDRPKPRVPEWDKDLRSGFGQEDAAEAQIKLFKESFGFLIPTYDKLALFLMAVTLILLFLMNGKMRDEVLRPTRHLDDYHLYILIIMTLPGMFVCLYNVFTSREKTNVEKLLMILFAVVVNGGTAIIAGNYMLKQSAGWLMIFPAWNIINGTLLLSMVRFGIINKDCISDREATVVQIILGLAAVLVIFILCNYVFKLYWAITFSICIVYTTSFDRALQNVFPGLTYNSNGQET